MFGVRASEDARQNAHHGQGRNFFDDADMEKSVVHFRAGGDPHRAAVKGRIARRGDIAPRLHQLQLWRGLRRPRICVVIGCDDFVGIRTQELAKGVDVESVVPRRKS